MIDQENEVVIEGADQDQDQGQGVLTEIAGTLVVGETDSEEETGQDSSATLFIDAAINYYICMHVNLHCILTVD